jgi:hypothetical protein
MENSNMSSNKCVAIVALKPNQLNLNTFLLEILQNLANQVENENPASDSQKGQAGQTKRVEKQTPKIIHTALKI